MKTMMKSKMFLASTAALVAVAALTFAAGSADAAISTTKHNLSSSGTGANKTDVGQICVFCHTPHGSATGASVPLWNKTLPAAGTFTTYSSTNSSTIDGIVETVGSVSIACLSCHDGSQAMDTVLNAPGSGTAWGTAPTWTGASTITGIANIGKDLTNDHPIGIQYGGGDGGTYAGSGDADFNQATKSGTADQWWVNTTTTGSTAGREKTDMILYTRDSTGNKPFVECASCHDPHSANPTFLRIENTESKVCLACHNK